MSFKNIFRKIGNAFVTGSNNCQENDPILQYRKKLQQERLARNNHDPSVTNEENSERPSETNRYRP
jgi:hypothetical protein